MRVLFDTNVVLDVLLDRAPHSRTAAALMSLADRGELTGIICATTVTTIHYLVAKNVGTGDAEDLLSVLLQIFELAPVDAAVLDAALESGFGDFEDAVAYHAAIATDATAIVTRNGDDFREALVPVFTPDELMAAFEASR